MNKFTALIVTAMGTVSIETDNIEALVELHGRITRAEYIEAPDGSHRRSGPNPNPIDPDSVLKVDQLTSIGTPIGNLTLDTSNLDETLPNGVLVSEATDVLIPLPPTMATAAASGAAFGAAQSAAPLPIPALSSAAAAPSATVPVAPISTTAPVPQMPAPSTVVAADAPAAAATPAGLVVDAEGLPWDPRIHSATMSKTADGNWRQKRNTDPAFIAQVKAELRQAMLANPPGGTHAQAPVAAPAAQAPVAAPAAQAPVAAPVSYASFMEELTGPMLSGKLSMDTLNGVVQEHGLPNLPALIHRPDMINAVRTAVLARIPA